MKIFAEGLVNAVDVFIHADYVSSTNPIEAASHTPLEGRPLLFLIVGVFTFISLVAYFVHYLKQRKKQTEDVEDEGG